MRTHWLVMVGVALLLTLTPTPLRAQDPAPVVPLTDMEPDALYRGEGGGLYGSAGNDIPLIMQPLVEVAVGAVQPLNAAGEPDPAGQIGLVSVGMSNTFMEFEAFMRLVQADSRLNPSLVLVNGAQGGIDTVKWNTLAEPWRVLDSRIAEAGLTAEQVQVIWLKTEVAGMLDYTAIYEEQQALRIEQIHEQLDGLREAFPNLRLILLSSRSYGGFSGGGNTSTTEPLSFEHGLAVRQVIMDGLRDQQALLDQPERYSEALPLLLWGPYLWAGETPRADGLFYEREDYARDGIHPSNQGQRKIAQVMLDYFTTSPATRSWFLAPTTD